MKRCCVPKCKTAINLRAVPYTDVTRWKKKDLIIGNQHAQWAFIERAYATDGAGGRARTIDLNDKHINPSSYDKMKNTWITGHLHAQYASINVKNMLLLV